jgi:metal-responsive CopG/Arc/MetJ family transcriptional regulator
MSRPISGGQKKTIRLHILLEPCELDELDDYRYTARLASRAETVRKLIRMGLEKAAAERLSNKEA